MPTYNYYCKKCDKQFSYFQKMSESAFTQCEECNGKINRMISGGTGLIFKGSGFYLTDYKNDLKKTKKVNENKNEQKLNSKTKTKTNSKEKKTNE